MGSNPTNQAGGAGSGTDSGAGKVNSSGAGRVDSHTGTAGAGLDPANGAEGLESVGLVAGESDPGRLIAEAEAAAAGAPADPLAGGAPPADLNPNGQWAALTPPAVEVLCAVVLPAWQIRNEEQRPVSEALAECLEQVFPGGIEGKYACWVRLIFACGAITVSRVAQHGKLPPLFFPKSAAKPIPQPTPPARDPNTLTSLTE